MLSILFLISSVVSFRIQLFGPTGAGKSYLGNLILERQVFIDDPSVTTSHTTQIQCASHAFNGVTVCDAPGLFDSNCLSNKYFQDLTLSMKLNPPNLIVIVVGSNRGAPNLKLLLAALKECVAADGANYLVISNHAVFRKHEKERVLADFQQLAKGYGKDLGVTDLRHSYFPTQRDDVVQEELANLLKPIQDTKLLRNVVVIDWLTVQKTYQTEVHELRRVLSASYDSRIDAKETHIRNLGISMPSTCWVPLLGSIACVAQGITVGVLRKEVEDLKKERASVLRDDQTVQNKKDHINGIIKNIEREDCHNRYRYHEVL